MQTRGAAEAVDVLGTGKGRGTRLLPATQGGCRGTMGSSSITSVSGGLQRGSELCRNKAWRDSKQLCECQQWLEQSRTQKGAGAGKRDCNKTHGEKTTDPSAGGWRLFLRDKTIGKQPGTAAGRSRSRECDGQELLLPKVGGFGQSRERLSCCDFINFTFSRVCSSAHHLRNGKDPKNCNK